MTTNISETIVPPNSVQLGMNLDFDEVIGAMVARKGTALVNAQLVDNNTILGLHNFRDTDGSAHNLLATINASGGATSVVRTVENNTNIVTGLTASKKMRFLTFLDSVLMINGTDAERSWDGASAITTGGAFDLANIPSSNTVSFCEEFLDRVYVAGDTAQPDRLYYSSVPSAGAVSWTSGNGNIDIEPENGAGGITALSKVPGYLLIFKARSMHRWNFNSAFPESLVSIGTPSQESVVKGGGLCAFFSASSWKTRGFYITNGDRPLPISHDRARNIKKWIDAIPQSYEANISGTGTETYFAWSIGDVTVDGIAYTNVVVKWNRIFDQWSVRSYPSEFRVFAHYIAASGLTGITASEHVIAAGDDDGNVLVIDNANNNSPTATDYPSSTPIRYDYISHSDNFNTSRIKEISERIIIRGNDIQGSKILVRSDLENWITLGEASKKEYTVLPIVKKIRGISFEFRIVGNKVGDRPIIKHIEIPHITVLDSYQ